MTPVGTAVGAVALVGADTVDSGTAEAWWAVIEGSGADASGVTTGSDAQGLVEEGAAAGWLGSAACDDTDDNGDVDGEDGAAGASWVGGNCEDDSWTVAVDGADGTADSAIAVGTMTGNGREDGCGRMWRTELES